VSSCRLTRAAASPQRRRAQLEAKLQQLTLNLAEEAGPRRCKRSRGEIIDKARTLHLIAFLWGFSRADMLYIFASPLCWNVSHQMV